MSKFSSRGLRSKYTNKLCLNDRQGLYIKNIEGVSELNHKSIKDWIDFDSKMIYNHVYKSVACKLKRLELSKIASDYLKEKLKNDHPKIYFNIILRSVIHMKNRETIEKRLRSFYD